MSIIIGSARIDEHGRASGGVGGDQKQTSIPDMSGEVSMQAMYTASKGWNVLRPRDSGMAARLGSAMARACNNVNIGYDQGNRYAIIKDGIDSVVKTECDCSSLVRACIIAASGNDPGNFVTANEVAVLEGTGLFQKAFGYTPTTPLCVGDILVTKTSGHTAIVVQVNGADSAAVYGGLTPSSGAVYDASGNALYTEVEFEPRLAAPMISDWWYIKQDEGGFSPFPAMSNVNYVWCRFSEIMDPDSKTNSGEHMGCNLSYGLPSDMYLHNEDGYTRNVACALGSVMCFYNKKNPHDGHVCIVEEMLEGGRITTSEMVGENKFQLVTRSKRYGSWDFDDYVFQGFIHNPAVGMEAIAESALETFCRIAEEQVGSDIGWTASNVSIAPNTGWSAAFVTACSKVAGSSLNIVVPNTTSVSAIGRIGILRNMGEWYDGPVNGEVSYPEIGDIVILRTANIKDPARHQGDRAGIVVSKTGQWFSAVVGGDDRVKRKDLRVSTPNIVGYFRPNWEQIDGTTDSVKFYRDLGGLYTEGTSIYDACARDIGYVSKSNQPSITPTEIRLAAINYTGMLANMYSVFAQSATSDSADASLIVDLWTNTVSSWYQDSSTQFINMSASVVAATSSSQTGSSVTAANIDVTANAKIAFEFLRAQGLSAAATCGILGNIKAESNFRTDAVGDHGTSFGICQWHAGRGNNMKAAVGANWSVNLTGQLNFLLTELRSGYKKCYSLICEVPDTEDGVKRAADVFVRKFEVPADVDNQSLKRQANALAYWRDLV